MLTFLRKSAQSVFIQALVLIIALVFVFWGVGSNMGNQSNAAAKVNGREISYGDFNSSYENMVENYRRQFGGTIPKGLLENMNLKQQVMNQLVQRELLRQGGEEMGIVISQAEIRDEIRQMPVFRGDDGEFDMEKYNAILKRSKLSPTAFEKSIHSELLTKQIVNAVNRFAIVTDNEQKMRVDFDNEEINFNYVEVKQSDYREKVEVLDEELAAWFEEHKDKYKSEPHIRLKYASFPVEQEQDSVVVEETKLRERYEQDKEKYITPEQRRARHILFKVAQTDSEEVKQEQKARAEKVLALANQDNDFAELAKEHSEGPTASAGGDLGFFTRGRMVKTFEDAAFSMREGEIGGPVESPFGYHIIKVEEIKPEAVVAFDTVKEQIRKEIQKEQAKAAAFTRANETYKQIIQARSVQKFEEQGGESLVTTDYFAKSAPPEGLPKDRAFVNSAFKLNKGELSSVVELNTSYAILFVDDIREAAVPELDGVRDQVVKDYQREKSGELAGAFAETLLAKAVESGSLAAAATEQELEPKESGYLKRAEAGTKTIPAQVITEAFSRTADAAMPSMPVAVGNSFFVFEVLDWRRAETEMNEQEQDKLREQLLAGNQSRILNKWLAHLEADSEVWVNKRFLE